MCVNTITFEPFIDTYSLEKKSSNIFDNVIIFGWVSMFLLSVYSNNYVNFLYASEFKKLFDKVPPWEVVNSSKFSMEFLNI